MGSTTIGYAAALAGLDDSEDRVFVGSRAGHHIPVELPPGVVLTFHNLLVAVDLRGRLLGVALFFEHQGDKPMLVELAGRLEVARA